MATPSKVGSRLRTLRTRRKLSLRALSDLAGVPLTTINSIELGYQQSIGAEKLARLARALGVASEELLPRIKRAG